MSSNIGLHVLQKKKMFKQTLWKSLLKYLLGLLVMGCLVVLATLCHESKQQPNTSHV